MLANAILVSRFTDVSLISTLADQQLQRPREPFSLSAGQPLEIANDNPRSVEDELMTRMGAAQQELSLVSMHLDAEFRRGTLRQLNQLLNPATWDEDDSYLDLGSFRSFARAMAALRPSVRPMLGLSERGHLLAMWGHGSARLSFEHLANDQLRWSIFSENAEGSDVAAGITSVGRVAQIIGGHGLGELLYGAG